MTQTYQIIFLDYSKISTDNNTDNTTLKLPPNSGKIFYVLKDQNTLPDKNDYDYTSDVALQFTISDTTSEDIQIYNDTGKKWEKASTERLQELFQGLKKLFIFADPEITNVNIFIQYICEVIEMNKDHAQNKQQIDIFKESKLSKPPCNTKKFTHSVDNQTTPTPGNDDINKNGLKPGNDQTNGSNSVDNQIITPTPGNDDINKNGLKTGNDQTNGSNSVDNQITTPTPGNDDTNSLSKRPDKLSTFETVIAQVKSYVVQFWLYKILARIYRLICSIIEKQDKSNIQMSSGVYL
jgi:hypothetical protein